MEKFYHVTEKWDGYELESLQAQYGDNALDVFVERWPEAENLAYEHSNRIHMFDNIADALDFKTETKSSQILEISLDDERKDEIFFMIDELEFNHPVACASIPAEYIKIWS